MSGFEYKVVPAPMRGLKGKGVKGTPARFANALQTVMNEFGAQGWEYQRTDTLPVEERQGLTGKTTTFQNMLVFRRAIEPQIEETAEIAALIEDQTEILEAQSATPQPAPAPVSESAAEESAATPQDPVDDQPPHDPATPAPMRLAVEDRVSETLTAPFSFPWNRRTEKSNAPQSTPKDVSHPAE